MMLPNAAPLGDGVPAQEFSGRRQKQADNRRERRNYTGSAPVGPGPRVGPERRYQTILGEAGNPSMIMCLKCARRWRVQRRRVRIIVLFCLRSRSTLVAGAYTEL
jgi:hypothetical protein